MPCIVQFLRVTQHVRDGIRRVVNRGQSIFGNGCGKGPSEQVSDHVAKVEESRSDKYNA